MSEINYPNGHDGQRPLHQQHHQQHHQQEQHRQLLQPPPPPPPPLSAQQQQLQQSQQPQQFQLQQINQSSPHHHYPIPPRTKERKSRRPHKNSRDGCPNCKHKRIKCSEELPSCHNCLKKNYHCGYLDFPKEKLEKLLRKHSKKTGEKYAIEQSSQKEHIKAQQFPEPRLTPLPPLSLSNVTIMNKNQFNAENVKKVTNSINNSGILSSSRFLSEANPNNVRPPPLNLGVPARLLNFSDNGDYNLTPGTPDLLNNSPSIITPPVPNQGTSIDSSPCSDTPNNVNEVFSNYLSTYIPNQTTASSTPPNIFDFVPDEDWGQYFFAPIGDSDLNMAVYKDAIKKFSSSRSDFQLPDILFEAPQATPNNVVPGSNSKKLTSEILETQNRFHDSDAHSVDSFERSFYIFGQHYGTENLGNGYNGVSKTDLASSSPSSQVGEPLPMAVISQTSFNVLSHPDKIKHLFTKNANKSKLVPENFGTLSQSQPELTEANAKNLWIGAFSQAIVLHYIYFTFFMDRALNVILKVCRNSVNSSSSTTCFTQKIEETLTGKSYAYFGTLIKNLRESVDGIDIESSTIVSWYAGWSLFLHTQASVKSIILFHGGSASLLWNCLNGYKSINELSPPLLFLTYALRNHTSAIVAPDYKFDVVTELYNDFIHFKKFINYNSELTTTKNGYILKQFVSLESFLKDLTQEIYPRFMKIDQFYKNKNGETNNSFGIKYFSPSMLYDVLTRWFKIVPSYAYSIGRGMTPLKRVFYLFFVAVAKAFIQVFPIIRCTFLIDTWNIIYPKTSFDYKLFKFSRSEVLNDSQYHYLTNLSAKLLRIIKFFNTREQIISHYMSAHTVLKPGEQFIDYINPGEGNPIEGLSVRDIVCTNPRKIDFKEIMITNFSINTIVNIYNYPILLDFGNHLNDITMDFRKIVEQENRSQKVRIQSYRARYEGVRSSNKNGETLTNVNHAYDFDFDRGMFSFDYNVELALVYLFNYLETTAGGKELTIEEAKNQALNFEASQKAVLHSLDFINDH